MRIDGVGTNPWPAGAPPAARPVAPPPQQNVAAQAVQQAIQQAEQRHGGGGGGGGHGHAKSLKPIEDVAARASLQIQPREKTVAERTAEIERMKALQKAAAEKVGDKPEGEGDGEQSKREQPPRDGAEEQPADS